MVLSDKKLADYRFPVQYVEIIERFLESRGVSESRLFDYCDIADPAEMYRGGWIDGVQIKKMFELCSLSRDTRKPVSAQLLEQFPVTAHGILGIVVMTSPTLQHALEAALKFYPLVIPAFQIRREEVKDQVHLIFEPLLDFGTISGDLMETAIGAFNSIQTYIAPEHVMLEMHFRHNNGYPLDCYSLFANPDRLYFNQPENKIILPKSQLHTAIITANQVTRKQFEQELERQIIQFSQQLSLSSKLETLLRDHLKTGGVLSIESAAEMVHVSPRTLSRRLADEHTSYSEVVNLVKLEYACFLLLNTQKSMAQIACAAGFANDSSFSRAFKKKKGISPREFRAGGGEP